MIKQELQPSNPLVNVEKLSVEYQLTTDMVTQLNHYMHLLIEWNEVMNLTAITDPASILPFHFEDSLILQKAIDVANLKGIVDVGSGAGFPGMVIKIAYPTVPVILVEVNHKKLTFLEKVAQDLDLQGIILCDYDWRTFLRKTSYEIDLICARASLRPDELIRMFRATSHYNQAQLVYWASNTWSLDTSAPEYRFFDHEFSYGVGNKKRKLIFFKNPTHNSNG